MAVRGRLPQRLEHRRQRRRAHAREHVGHDRLRCLVGVGVLLLVDRVVHVQLVERIADHCSNVAVAIIELELNVFDTHEYLINLKKDNGTNFDKYFEEYKEMFPLSQY